MRAPPELAFAMRSWQLITIVQGVELANSKFYGTHCSQAIGYIMTLCLEVSPIFMAFNISSSVTKTRKMRFGFRSGIFLDPLVKLCCNI